MRSVDQLSPRELSESGDAAAQTKATTEASTAKTGRKAGDEWRAAWVCGNKTAGLLHKLLAGWTVLMLDLLVETRKHGYGCRKRGRRR